MAELSPDIRETIRELPVGREWLFYLGGNDSARATASWTHRSSRLPHSPSGCTVMKPRIGRPVKSIGRA
jgi:hypothetical protein